MTSSAPTPNSPVEHIVLCTARYSPNLGDGIIAETEEYLLKAQDPSLTILHLDIAGRQDFELEEPQGGFDLLKAFRRIPDALQPLAMRVFFKLRIANKLRLAWNAIDPKQPFFFILGGGHLLSDLALNFPLKINFYSKLVMARSKGAAITSVGVGPSWSAAAKRLVSAAIDSDTLVHASVRDAKSAANWRANLGTIGERPRTTIDPAICCDDVYSTYKKPPGATPKAGKPIIGLGVTLPQELMAYSASLNGLDDSFFLDFWTELTANLVGLKYQPVFFTNGTREDEAFLDRLLQPAAMSAHKRLERPIYPKDLVRNITQCDAIVSHRLHASVISYAFDIPSVFLECDPKVQSFAKATQREDYLLANPLNAVDGAHRVKQALDAGIDLDFKALLTQKVHEEFKTMLKSLRKRTDR